MERITVSIEQEQLDLIDKLSQEDGPCESRSESMRFVIKSYERDRNLKQEVDDLEARLDESRNREIARDNTQAEITRLRQDIEESEDAPFFIKWYRWFRAQE